MDRMRYELGLRYILEDGNRLGLLVAMPYNLSRAGAGAIALHTLLWAEQTSELREAFVSSAHNAHLPMQIRRKTRSYPFFRYLNVLQPNMSCKLFDLIVLRAVRTGDYVYTVSGNTPYLARRCRKVRAHLIIDSPTSHTLTQRNLYREELVRLGILGAEDSHHFDENWSNHLRYNLEQYREAEYISCPSTFVYDSFVAHGLPEEKLRLVHYGVDTMKFRPGKKDEDTFRVLFVGINKIRKGLRYLLLAWRKFEKNFKESCELVVVGRSTIEERNILAPYYNGLRNVRRIEYAHDLVSLYQSSSLLVLPSLEDGTGLVVVEAMACGTPVIVSETTGFRDLVNDKQNGFIVPSASVKAIEEKLQYMAENRGEVERMGSNARKTAEEHSWFHYREALSKAYGDLL